MPNFDQWNEHKDIPTHVPTSEITKRISKDVTVNSFGRKLIALCSNLNLYILNGRIGIDQKNVGEWTCKNASVVDYCIVSQSLLQEIESFYVDTFDPVLSDIHCPIVCSLCVSKPQEPQKPQISSRDQSQPHQRSTSLHCGQNTIVRPKWDWDLQTVFQENLDELAIRNI